jgi:Tfp pilus assembly protein PilN
MREVNLIPCEVALQEEIYSRLRLWLKIFAGIGAVLCVLFLIQEQIVARIDDEVRDLVSRNNALEARYQEVKNLQQKQSELAKRASVVESLLARRDFTRPFFELERSMTPAMRLTHVSLDKKGYDAQGGTEEEWVDTGYIVVKKMEHQKRGRSKISSVTPGLVIEGITLNPDDLAQFIRVLEQSQLFTNVNLRQYNRNKGEKEKIAFEIEAQLTR